ncbi:MAG: WcaI family glycosyltransferase [Chitinophagaceae bacterium]
MRILIYGINYAPELTGIGKYTGEMGAWLAKQGHSVDVITAMPYYPEWEIHEKYKGKWFWFKEKIDGVTVYRCPLYVPKKITSLKRILHEFSFIASVFPLWLRTMFQKRYDFVIAISPPFHLGFFPLLYSKLRGVKMITHIQDLQVDAAKNLAMVKNGRFLNMMFGAEKFILKKSSVVSSISKGMLKKIKGKNIKGLKAIFFPNWVDENELVPLPKESSMRREFGLADDDKVILYSGNLGEKQGLEVIINVARQFIDRSNVHFLIVGSGGNKENLQKMAADEKLFNIHFHPLVAMEKFSALLATADLHLVLQKQSASDLVMPSKLAGILSAGGCAVVTANPGTSLFEVVNDNNIGLVIEPESPVALKACLEKALQMDLEPYRKRARSYAKAYLSKEWIMRNFERELYNGLTSRSKPILVYDPIEIVLRKAEMQKMVTSK